MLSDPAFFLKLCQCWDVLKLWKLSWFVFGSWLFVWWEQPQWWVLSWSTDDNLTCWRLCQQTHRLGFNGNLRFMQFLCFKKLKFLKNLWNSLPWGKSSEGGSLSTVCATPQKMGPTANFFTNCCNLQQQQIEPTTSSFRFTATSFSWQTPMFLTARHSQAAHVSQG